MNLDDLATKAPTKAPGKKCSMCWLLATVDAETAAKIDAAMRNPSAQWAEISAALARLGYTIAGGTISRCARGMGVDCPTRRPANG